MIESFLPDGWIVGDVHKVRLPTYINVSKKTRKALNLNIYRNLHHHHLNKQKQNFYNKVKPLLRNIPRAEKIWLHYTIFAPRNGRLDTMNVGSIVDKYFSDTLVETKKIMDDHFGHIVLISFSFGGVMPMNGHAIAKIHILKKTQKEYSIMRVILDQEDIQTALETYVESMGITGANGVELSIEDGNIVAEVTMGNIKPTTVTINKSRTGRPRGSRNKPKVTTKPEVMDDNKNNFEDDNDGTDSGSDQSTEEDSSTGEKLINKSKNSKQGNLFGDEENQSSESNEKITSKIKIPETGKTPMKTTKKSSIFDVD